MPLGRIGNTKSSSKRSAAKASNCVFSITRPIRWMRKGREKLVRELLGGTGKTLWLEAPIHFAYGYTTVGDHFYSNFNLTVVDDGRVSIGNSVMFGPNVTISTTGHPFTRITGCGRALFPAGRHRGRRVDRCERRRDAGRDHRQKQRDRRGKRRDARHSGERRRLRHAVPRGSPDYGCGFETIRPGMTINADWNA